MVDLPSVQFNELTTAAADLARASKKQHVAERAAHAATEEYIEAKRAYQNALRNLEQTAQSRATEIA